MWDSCSFQVGDVHERFRHFVWSFMLHNSGLVIYLGLDCGICCIAGAARLPGFHVCVGSGGDKQPPEWYAEKGWLVLNSYAQVWVRAWRNVKVMIMHRNNEVYLLLDTVCYILPMAFYKLCQILWWRHLAVQFVQRLFMVISQWNLWCVG